jgi:hypothetical protein
MDSQDAHGVHRLASLGIAEGGAEAGHAPQVAQEGTPRLVVLL